MARIDMRKFEDVRPLVRTRLLSSEVYNIENIVKEHRFYIHPYTWRVFS